MSDTADRIRAGGQASRACRTRSPNQCASLAKPSQKSAACQPTPRTNQRRSKSNEQRHRQKREPSQRGRNHPPPGIALQKHISEALAGLQTLSGSEDIQISHALAMATVQASKALRQAHLMQDSATCSTKRPAGRGEQHQPHAHPQNDPARRRIKREAPADRPGTSKKPTTILAGKREP